MKKLLLFLSCLSLNAQVGIGTIAPDENAMLEIASNDKGLLLPRVELRSITSALPLSAHVKGMIVYNTAQEGMGTGRVYPGLYYNDGENWIRFNPNTVKNGELKHSFAVSDHNGWYLLNGRAVTTLPPNPMANAIVLGYSTNLPDAADLFLKTRTGSETLGSVGGTDSFIIAQNNLPNVNFTGTTNAAGSHNHNVDSYRGNENIGLLSTTALTLFVTETVAKEVQSTTTRTTKADGNHTHSVSFNSGGTNTPVSTTPKYLSTNIFIYLGN